MVPNLPFVYIAVAWFSSDQYLDTQKLLEHCEYSSVVSVTEKLLKFDRGTVNAGRFASYRKAAF